MADLSKIYHYWGPTIVPDTLRFADRESDIEIDGDPEEWLEEDLTEDEDGDGDEDED